MKQDNIPFNQYFSNWLYGDNGYYSKYKNIGKNGDFYTSVSSSKFFGGAIGKRGIDIVEDMNGKYWFIEINGNPAFGHFVDDCGSKELDNLMVKILSDIISK